MFRRYSEEKFLAACQEARRQHPEETEQQIHDRAAYRLKHLTPRWKPPWRVIFDVLMAIGLIILLANAVRCEPPVGRTIRFPYGISGRNTVFAQIGLPQVVRLQVRSAANVWTDVGFAGGDLNVPISGSVSLIGTNPFNLAQVGGTPLAGAAVSDAANNAFRVNCVVGCVAGGSFTDNTAFTAGATTITNVGGVFNDGLAAVTSGNAAAPRITAQRALHTNLRNNAGSELASSTTAPAGTELGLIVRNIPSGTQPVSGTVTSNIGTTGGLALDATVAAVQPRRIQDGAGATLASVTAANALKVDNSAVTQPVSGTVTSNQGTANATPWNQNLAQYGGASTSLGPKAGASSIPVVPATDYVPQDTVGATGALNALNAIASVAVTGRSGTGMFLAAGTLIGTIVPEISYDGGTTWVASQFDDPATGAIASSIVFAAANGAQTQTIILNGGASNARVRVSAFTSGTANATLRATSVWTDSTSRVTPSPPQVLGCYSVGAGTGVYTGLAAGAPLFSMRWGDATRVALILHVTVTVIQSAPATTAGRVDRRLIIARSFTVSDSAGTVITLTGNNQKLRTSFPTSLVTDMRIAAAAALTAGTRTLDAQGVGIAATWLDLSSASTAAVAASTFPHTRIIDRVDLWNAQTGFQHPIVLAQNEGIIIDVPTAQPAGSSLSTFVDLQWCEAANY